ATNRAGSAVLDETMKFMLHSAFDRFRCSWHMLPYPRQYFVAHRGCRLGFAQPLRGLCHFIELWRVEKFFQPEREILGTIGLCGGTLFQQEITVRRLLTRNR